MGVEEDLRSDCPITASMPEIVDINHDIEIHNLRLNLSKATELIKISQELAHVFYLRVEYAHIDCKLNAILTITQI